MKAAQAVNSSESRVAFLRGKWRELLAGCGSLLVLADLLVMKAFPAGEGCQ